MGKVNDTIEAAKIQADALIKAADAAKINYNQLLNYQVKAISGIAGANKSVMPGLADTAVTLGKSFAESINPQIASEFYSYLSNLNPRWKEDAIGQQQEALYQVADYSRQLMTGELDKETIDQTMRTMAEYGYASGQFGGLASSNVARNLGLTSLQLKQQGAQLFTEAVSPLSARLLSTTKELMPPTINAGAMASQMLGYLAGSLGSSQTGQQGVIAAAQTNADIAWSSRLSAFNAQQDVNAMTINMAMFNKALKVQQENNKRNAFASVMGSIGAGIGTAS